MCLSFGHWVKDELKLPDTLPGCARFLDQIKALQYDISSSTGSNGQGKVSLISDNFVRVCLQ